MALVGRFKDVVDSVRDVPQQDREGCARAELRPASDGHRIRTGIDLEILDGSPGRGEAREEKRRGGERGVKMSIWGRLSASVLQVVVVVEVVFWHGDLPFGVVDVERGVANRKRSSPSLRASLFFSLARCKF